MKQDWHDTYQDSTVTVFSYLSCRVRGERPSTSSWSSKLSVSSPANGSSWYGLTSEEYSASSYSDDPLSETTEETEETAIPSAIAKNDTLRYVVVFTPCKPNDVTGVWHCSPFLLMGIKQKSFKTAWTIHFHPLNGKAVWLRKVYTT